MEIKEKLKELALELREIWEENRLSRRSSKFETYFKYILNEDITIKARRNLFKKFAEYQYLMGKFREKDTLSEDRSGGRK